METSTELTWTLFWILSGGVLLHPCNNAWRQEAFCSRIGVCWGTFAWTNLSGPCQEAAADRPLLLRVTQHKVCCYWEASGGTVKPLQLLSTATKSACEWWWWLVAPIRVPMHCQVPGLRCSPGPGPGCSEASSAPQGEEPPGVGSHLPPFSTFPSFLRLQVVSRPPEHLFKDKRHGWLLQSFAFRLFQKTKTQNQVLAF